MEGNKNPECPRQWKSFKYWVYVVLVVKQCWRDGLGHWGGKMLSKGQCQGKKWAVYVSSSFNKGAEYDHERFKNNNPPKPGLAQTRDLRISLHTLFYDLRTPLDFWTLAVSCLEACKVQFLWYHICHCWLRKGGEHHCCNAEHDSSDRPYLSFEDKQQVRSQCDSKL